MGGPDKVARQHEFNKLTIRERIVAIVGATVHTVSGADIENGVVVMADGKITAVTTDGLGSRAGVKIGDAIVELWSEPVETTLEMARQMRKNREEKFVSITVSRDGNHVGLRAER